jgi:hypothetical protein
MACGWSAPYSTETITVYQAYGPQVADAAVRAGTFVPPFSRERMTWIKPSLGWMIHRSGWAAKPGQERVLAIEISRAGSEWALAHSCLSHYQPGLRASPEDWAAMKETSPVRIQWDPDRAEAAARRLSAERVYPLDPVLAARIGADLHQRAMVSETGGGR